MLFNSIIYSYIIPDILIHHLCVHWYSWHSDDCDIYSFIYSDIHSDICCPHCCPWPISIPYHYDDWWYCDCSWYVLYYHSIIDIVLTIVICILFGSIVLIFDKLILTVYICPYSYSDDTLSCCLMLLLLLILLFSSYSAALSEE